MGEHAAAETIHPLVRATAAYGLDGTHLRLPAQPLPEREWQALVAGASRHRVVGLLAAAVEDGALPAEEAQRAELEALHAEAMRKCLVLDSDLLRVALLLDEAQIRHRVLKGPAVAHLDYPDPAWRTYGDIDLLIPGDEFDASVRALEGVGYWRHHREIRPGFDSRFGKGSCLENATGREIDLHRTLAMGAFGLAIHLDDLWAHTVVLRVGGHDVRALSPECRALHACYHAALGNRSPGLLPLRDLAGMLTATGSDFDLDEFLDMARRWRGQAVVARAVRFAWTELGLPDSPLSAWASAFEPSSQDRRALRTYSDPSLGYAARQFAAVGFLPRTRDRIDFVFAMLLPDRRYGAGRHGAHRRRFRAAGSQIIRLLRPSRSRDKASGRQ